MPRRRWSNMWGAIQIDVTKQTFLTEVRTIWTSLRSSQTKRFQWNYQTHTSLIAPLWALLTYRESDHNSTTGQRCSFVLHVVQIITEKLSWLQYTIHNSTIVSLCTANLVPTLQPWKTRGRGGNLIYKGYSHKKNRKFRGKQVWTCVQPGCLGRFHTVNEVDGPTATVVHFNPHGHIVINSVAMISNETKAISCTNNHSGANPASTTEQSLQPVHQKCWDRTTCRSSVICWFMPSPNAPRSSDSHATSTRRSRQDRSDWRVEPNHLRERLPTAPGWQIADFKYWEKPMPICHAINRADPSTCPSLACTKTTQRKYRNLETRIQTHRGVWSRQLFSSAVSRGNVVSFSNWDAK